MTGFSQHTGRFIPLDVANVDTDAIIPKQFLQKITRAGFGQHLFHDWRFLNDDATQPNPDFVLNKPAYKGARILLTRANFGCGSSREHAPWALSDYGFQVIIAPSFADIFYNNAFNSALLPVQLTEEEIDSLFRLAAENPTQELTVDLKAQTVKAGENGPTYHFKIDPFRRDCLLHGLDTIGLTLKLEEEIERYEEGRAVFLSL